MSLLLEHGHAHAQDYPIGLVWVEAALVTERINGLKADQAVLTQMAVSSLFGKDGKRSFNEALKELRERPVIGDGEARR